MIRTQGHRTLPSRGGAVLAGLLMITSLACFEDPVREDLALQFFPDGSVQIRVTVLLSPEEEFRGHPKARKRLEFSRQSLLRGQDRWSRRLEELGPSPTERILLEKHHGILRRVERIFLLKEAERIRDLFGDTMIEVSFERGNGWDEISLVPGPGSRATFRQQEEVRLRFEDWVTAVEGYVTAVSALYRYLEQNPHRARSCFGDLFEDLIEPGSNRVPVELGDRERALVDAVGDSLEAVLSPLQISEDEARSLEELSRLVHDPFPAPLEVSLPDEVLEMEGFVAAERDRFVVPRLSFWNSLRSAEDRWLSPSPAFAILEVLRGDEETTFDLDDFSARPRHHSPSPPEWEIREALAEALQTAPLYRLRWRAVGD